MKQPLSTFVDPQPVRCHFPAGVCCANQQTRTDGAFALGQDRAQLSPQVTQAGWSHQLRMALVSLSDNLGCQASTVLPLPPGFDDPDPKSIQVTTTGCFDSGAEA